MPKTDQRHCTYECPVTDHIERIQGEPGKPLFELPPRLERHIATCTRCAKNDRLTLLDLLQCVQDDVEKALAILESKIVKDDNSQGGK